MISGSRSAGKFEVDMSLEDISLIMNDGAKFVGKDGIPLEMNYFQEYIKQKTY